MRGCSAAVVRFRRKLRTLQHDWSTGRIEWEEVQASVAAWVGHAMHVPPGGSRTAVIRRGCFSLARPALVNIFRCFAAMCLGPVRLLTTRRYRLCKGKREKNKGKLFPRTPKPVVDVTERRIVLDTVRRADAPRTVVPGTAAERSILPIGGLVDRCLRALSSYLSPYNQRPTPGVPEHIVQT